MRKSDASISRSHRAAAPALAVLGPQSVACAELQPSALVASFPGPAFALNDAMQVTAENLAAAGLTSAMRARNSALLGPIANVLHSGAPAQTRLTLDPGGAGHDSAMVFELTLLPLRAADGASMVLVLARDGTLTHNMTHALIESRRLFKDLVACSSDFAWETDAEGRFKYISPKGALGYAPRELNGIPAWQLLHPHHRHLSPFSPGETIDELEVWLLTRDGDAAIVQVSALPVYDANGNPAGARGACHDVTQLRAQEAELARAHAQLEQLARTDELTGLFNRRAFCAEVEKRLAAQRRGGQPGALLFIDLDNFKAINDHFGHQAGDDVLRGVSAMLREQCRPMDMPSRLGGDEFVIWLENTDIAGAVAMGQRLLAGAEALRAVASHPEKPLALSIGLVVSAGQALDDLFASADAAMYRAKKGGKNSLTLAGTETGDHEPC